MAWRQVGTESDVPLGVMKPVRIDDTEVTVYHLEDGWFATSDICTHQNCALSEGEIDGEEIVCWCHGGAFDIRTGVATRMPCVVPVETFAVRIRENQIEIDFT